MCSVLTWASCRPGGEWERCVCSRSRRSPAGAASTQSCRQQRSRRAGRRARLPVESSRRATARGAAPAHRAAEFAAARPPFGRPRERSRLERRRRSRRSRGCRLERDSSERMRRPSKLIRTEDGTFRPPPEARRNGPPVRVVACSPLPPSTSTRSRFRRSASASGSARGRRSTASTSRCRAASPSGSSAPTAPARPR